MHTLVLSSEWCTRRREWWRYLSEFCTGVHAWTATEMNTLRREASSGSYKGDTSAINYSNFYLSSYSMFLLIRRRCWCWGGFACFAYCLLLVPRPPWATTTTTTTTTVISGALSTSLKRSNAHIALPSCMKWNSYWIVIAHTHTHHKQLASTYHLWFWQSSFFAIC